MASLNCIRITSYNVCYTKLLRQTLTIKGRLVNHGTVNLRWSATRYCDLIFDGAGDVLTGTSSTTMLLRNLMFNNAGAKTITYTGGIELRTGAGVNVFVNNGGALTVTSGAVRLIDAFEINGSGAITFNDLQCGSNNQTIQTLNRDVTVNGVMTLWHSNTLSSYFNINGYTLTLLGDVRITSYNVCYTKLLRIKKSEGVRICPS